MAGRAVDGIATVPHGEVVGDRDRLVVRDEEPVLRAGRRAPAPHPGVGAGLQQEDRRAAALALGARGLRHRALMRPPAGLGRLHALRQKTLAGPGVDEDIAGLGMACALGIALGDVDALDADVAGEARALFPRLRLASELLGVARDV